MPDFPDFDNLDADFGAADFGDAFDALPDLDFGADATAALDARKARLVEALVSGETGVQFDALALFAEPLFTLYDLDPAEAFVLRAPEGDVDEEAVALMETARVLWAFFSLPPAERARRRSALAAQLIGENPSDDDWVSLDALLDAAEIHWQALLPDEIAAAQATGSPTLDFDALVLHPVFRVGDDAPDAGVGPDGLSDVEARALFAQALLDDTADDPDAFESAVARADVYWSLVTGPAPEAALDAYAETQPDAATVRAEGRRMLAHYRRLFGGA